MISEQSFRSQYLMKTVSEKQNEGRLSCCSSVNLNAMAALLHAVQAVVVLALVSWLNTQPNSGDIGVFPLDRTISIWHKKTSNTSLLATFEKSMVTDDYFVEHRKLASGFLDVRYVIAAFFVLSSIFQAIGGYILGDVWGSRLRFIEYSFSASIMIIAIGVEAGIRDLYTLEMMFILTWVTMILGLLAEIISTVLSSDPSIADRDPILQIWGIWSWLIPHVAGWVTCVAAYAPIIDVFVQSSTRSDVSAPGFVHVIVSLQFALFSCFGFVQMYSLVKKTYIIMTIQGSFRKYAAVGGGEEAQDYYRDLYALADTVEKAYVTLSFVAKTLLAWLILSPILVSAIK
jgi:hypothetical protein